VFTKLLEQVFEHFGFGLVCEPGFSPFFTGVVLGDNFIVTQILPLLKNVVRFCIDVSSMNKPEPMQSWNSLALVDCLIALDGVIAFLQQEVLVKELLEVLVWLYTSFLFYLKIL